jgi:hypothetical protein
MKGGGKMKKIIVVSVLAGLATVSCAPVYYSDVVVDPTPSVVYTPASSVYVTTTRPTVVSSYPFGYRDRYYSPYMAGNYSYQQVYYY